jgi:sulfate permease, SulP family
LNSSVRQEPGQRISGRDVIAGISVALILIPQGMAYAELAGLPAHHGLYAAALPPILAAFFASSPYLQTGPTALTALLTLGALVPLAAVGTAEYIGLAAGLALVVGVVRFLVGLLKGGWLSYLLSRPMLTGFTSAAAVLIMASQLPEALGSAAPEGGVLARAGWALAHPGSWEAASVVLAAITVGLVRGGRKIHPLLPGVLIAAAVGLAFSIITGYTGDMVGDIPSGLPPFSVDLPWARFSSLILPGSVIALVGFAEVASISRAFASEDRQSWDSNREFLSQGAANLAAAFSGGLPVGGSFSRSGLVRLAGARTRWSGLITGLVVLLFLPFASVLAPLPKAILAGIVLAAVWSLLKPKELMALWPASRPQALVGWGTFGLTLALSPRIDKAVLAGVAIAGAVHLWRELKPGVQARREGNTLHLEPSGVLWFGSAPALEDAFLTRLAEEPDVTHVVVHCDGLGRIDLTGAMGLADLLEQVTRAGLQMEIKGVPPHARRILKSAGIAPSDATAVE